jgi:hypothetical protein
MKNKSTYMGTASEKSCLRNNIFVIWELSFIGNTRCKKGNEYWLAWLRLLNSKKVVKDLKHHLQINGVNLIAFECRRSFHVFPFIWDIIRSNMSNIIINLIVNINLIISEIVIWIALLLASIQQWLTIATNLHHEINSTTTRSIEINSATTG